MNKKYLLFLLNVHCANDSRNNKRLTFAEKKKKIQKNSIQESIEINSTSGNHHSVNYKVFYFFLGIKKKRKSKFKSFYGAVKLSIF